MNTSVRRGRGVSVANALASSTTPIVPEASSSAPLQIESAPEGWQPAPPPTTPMWSMCPVKNTYSARSCGSLPSSTPMTFGALVCSTTRRRTPIVSVTPSSALTPRALLSRSTAGSTPAACSTGSAAESRATRIGIVGAGGVPAGGGVASAYCAAVALREALAISAGGAFISLIQPRTPAAAPFANSACASGARRKVIVAGAVCTTMAPRTSTLPNGCAVSAGAPIRRTARAVTMLSEMGSWPAATTSCPYVQRAEAPCPLIAMKAFESTCVFRSG